MNKTQALETLRSVTYKPGWNFVITDNYTDPTGSTGVRIDVDWPAPLSDEQYAPEYAERVELIRTTGLSDEAIHGCPNQTLLLRWLIDWIIAIEIHEAREFFRLDHTERPAGDRPAPFHPHKQLTNIRWETSGVQIGSPFVQIEDPS